jgi:hypothetical protein
MPAPVKPLFLPEALRTELAAFHPPQAAVAEVKLLLRDVEH